MLEKSMMKKLKEKGVPADVILDLLLDEDQPAPTPEAPEDPAPQEAPAAPEKPAAPDPVLAAIEKLTGAVQAMNQRQNYVETPGRETTDEILSKIIK